MVNYRRLGKTGMEVSEIGFGAWGIGGRQWLGGDDRESLRALRRALELGVNFLDTALAYNEGHSERLIAEVLRDAPGRVRVATKVPPENRLWPARPGIPIGEVFPHPYIVACTETSLRNLGVETIDLQQLHVWNPVPGALAETALRFCLSHTAVSTVIPGMRKVAHVEANSSVSAAGPLQKEVLARL
jgi:aryl-alcohol dehydrogenase-like predicted oxidoreductase